MTNVPQALRFLPKPYDIDSPIFELEMDSFEPAALVECAWSSQTSASDQPAELTKSPFEFGLSRLTLFVGWTPYGHLRMRLYCAQDEGKYYLTPILEPNGPLESLSPPAGPALDLFTTLRERLGAALPGVSIWNDEPSCRAALYSCALAVGLRASTRITEALSVHRQSLCTEDFSFLFGSAPLPCLASGADSSFPLLVPAPQPAPTGFTQYVVTPHVLAKLGDRHFLCLRDLLAAFFELLSDLVGASDPAAYALDWPYTPEQIHSDPYLRLRIGPTFGDLRILVTTFRKRLPAWESLADAAILLALDRLIDDGIIVPTIGKYNDSFYRIYRKGEGDSREAWRTWSTSCPCSNGGFMRTRSYSPQCSRKSP